MIRTILEFHGARDVRLTEEETPELKPGELLIRTLRSLISTGTESICYTRNFAPDTHFDRWVKYPFRPGYLNCGIVEAIGPGVSDRKVGDRVANRGGHASHVVVAEANSALVPANVADADAAWTGLGKITQIGVRAAEHKLGDAVVVIGLGLLGQLVVQYATLLGARTIIAIDPWPERLAQIPAHLPVHKLACNAADAEDDVLRLTGGRRADVVYDATGHHAVFPAALSFARQFGTVVILGDTGQPHLQALTPDLIIKGLKIVGAHDEHAGQADYGPSGWNSPRISDLFLNYVSKGQIQIGPLVSHHFQPGEARMVYEFLQEKRATAMGVMFDWN